MAFVAFEPAAAQAVAALEVADPALHADPVALSTRVRREPCSWRPVMWIVSARPSSAVWVGACLNPPSTITSRSLMPRFSSSAAVLGSSVSSAGLPIWLWGGRMNPRAPGLVLAVIPHAVRHTELVGV